MKQNKRLALFEEENAKREAKGQLRATFHHDENGILTEPGRVWLIVR